MTQSRKSPEWLRKGIIYQLFLRAFTPEGTIKAATPKLPKLKELGINIVYLSPVCLQDDDMRQEFWSDRQVKCGENNPRNPYRVKDFYAIDPEYGIEDDLREFVGKCHELGLKVLLDVVYFHCGPTAPLIKESPNFVKRNPDGSVLIGEWHFPVFDFDNPELREYFFDNMNYWVDKFGIDGYRCDSASHVPLDFWEEAHRRLDATGKEIILFAECCRPQDQLSGFDVSYSYIVNQLVEALQNKRTTEIVYNNVKWLEDAFPKGALISRFIDNHDHTQNDGKNRLESILGFDAVNAALATIFTLEGVPFVYNGQEIADKTKHSIYANYSIDWKNAETEEGKKRFELIQKLCSLRANHKALTNGAFAQLKNSNPDHVLSYLRKEDNETLLVIINLNSTHENVSIDGLTNSKNEYHKLLSIGTKPAPFSNGVNADIAPYGFAICKI